MTESLKFTSPAPAPVSGVLACADSSGSTENNVRLARVIDIELYGRGTEQHVKIKVGTLRALTDAVELLAKEKETLVGRLDERAEDLGVAAGKLEDWRTFTRHILDRFFVTYPTSVTNDDQLRIILKAAIESSRNESARLKGERENVINLNRSAAEEIQHLQKRAEHLDQTIVDLVRQRDKNGQQANQLACEVNDLKKQRERLTHLADDYRRDLDAAAQRCVALTNDAQALTKQRDEVLTRLANARLQIADLKRRLDGEVVQSANVYSNIRSHAEAQENALLQRITLLEGENRELATKLANAGLEIASYELLVKDLKAGTAVDRDTVKRQEQTIEQLYGQLNGWHDWATDVICSPSSMGAEAQRTAITSAMRKRKERVETLEATVKAIAAQRDAWVLWAKSYTDTCAVVYTNEQLLSLVKAKVKVSTVDIDGKQTMCGTLKVTKLKDDVVVSGEPVKEYVLPSARGWAMVKENAVIMNGCIPASKVTLSDEMKAAIREVIRDEIADLNKAVVDILSKMRK
nr:hypothetical protein K49PH164C2_LOCUS2 [Klebsiella phage vB_Kpl_K49PH164C2]